MGIPEHDIKDAAVRDGARRAHHGDPKPMQELFAGADKERQLLILAKLADRSNMSSNDQECVTFARALIGMANEIREDDRVTFSAQDRALALTAVQLARLSPAVDPDMVLDVLEGLPNNALRIRVARWIDDELDNQPSHKLAWPPLVTARLADDAVSRIVQNLVQGDVAADDEAISYQIMFVVEKHRTEQLRDKIAELFRDGTIDVPTLASRLVSSHSIVGVEPDWRLSPEIDQKLFDLIAPLDDHAWYDKPLETVDDRDRSWANEKLFAAARFQRPLRDQAEQTAEEAEGGGDTG